MSVPEFPGYPEDEQPPPPPQQHRSTWATVGIVLGVVAAVAGLLVVAAGILFVVGLNAWASNK